MKKFLQRLKFWIRKPEDINCSGICLDCKWFDLCSKETTPELQHPDLEHMPLPIEYRCMICENRFECPAYDTGVIFPCAYFKEEHYG